LDHHGVESWIKYPFIVVVEGEGFVVGSSVL